jgi:hypothetical protein
METATLLSQTIGVALFSEYRRRARPAVLQVWVCLFPTSRMPSSVQAVSRKVIDPLILPKRNLRQFRNLSHQVGPAMKGP